MPTEKSAATHHAPDAASSTVDTAVPAARSSTLSPGPMPQRRAGGPPPVPVLAQRQHGVGDVVAARDAVEHRRHLTGILVQRRAAHARDGTCERANPGMERRRDALHNGMSEKVWFITGTSRGFGREWAIAALERGDKVAATARDTATLDDLVEKYGDAMLPIQLDVTDRDADFAAVKQAHDHFGRLDIVVNNAGYGQFGFVEELSEQDARDQIETNVFGALWVTQAALPYPAGAAQRPHHPGVVDRRHHRVPERRHLPRLQVGAGGLLAVAGAGGRAVRRARHA